MWYLVRSHERRCFLCFGPVRAIFTHVFAQSLPVLWLFPNDYTLTISPLTKTYIEDGVIDWYWLYFSPCGFSSDLGPFEHKGRLQTVLRGLLASFNLNVTVWQSSDIHLYLGGLNSGEVSEHKTENRTLKTLKIALKPEHLSLSQTCRSPGSCPGRIRPRPFEPK